MFEADVVWAGGTDDLEPDRLSPAAQLDLRELVLREGLRCVRLVRLVRPALHDRDASH